MACYSPLTHTCTSLLYAVASLEDEDMRSHRRYAVASLEDEDSRRLSIQNRVHSVALFITAPLMTVNLIAYTSKKSLEKMTYTCSQEKCQWFRLGR